MSQAAEVISLEEFRKRREPRSMSAPRSAPWVNLWTPVWVWFMVWPA